MSLIPKMIRNPFQFSKKPIRFHVLFALLLFSSSSFASSIVDLIPTKSVQPSIESSQACQRFFYKTQNVRKYDITTEYLEPSAFPIIPFSALEKQIEYDVEVPMPSVRQQCQSACTYYSVTNYLEAYLKKVVPTDSQRPLRLSPNSLLAEDLVRKYELALSKFQGFRGQILSGSWLFEVLQNALRFGVYTESDFPSSWRIDVSQLESEINGLLSELNVEFSSQQISEISKNKTIPLIQKSVDAVVGVPRVGSRKLSMRSLLNGVGVVSYDFLDPNRGEYQLYSAPELNQKLSETFDREFLFQHALREIVKSINQGLPVLFSYKHAPDLLDPETGIYSLQSFDDDPHFPISYGHAALITGYKLNAHDQIEFLKIQNSSERSPMLHIPLDYFIKSTYQILFLK